MSVSETQLANTHIYGANPILEQAEHYFALGFTPIPVKFRAKRPIRDDWPNFKPKAEDIRRIFGAEQLNIGVVLGKSSGGLIDIDLDTDIAIRFAPYFLPATGMIFGRKSRPFSHRIYIASPPPAPSTKVFDGPRGRIVELRGEGGQTVFPGSIHESGEAIEFEKSGEPDPALPSRLEFECRQIAIATTIYEHWVPGKRHGLALGLSGLFAKAGWGQTDVLAFISALVTESNDNERADRENCVRTTYDKIAQGHETSIEGYRAVANIVGNEIASVIAKLAGPSACHNLPESSSQHGAIKLTEIITDASAAEAFWRCHKDEFIFCDGPDSWFQRDGQTFRPISHVRIQGEALTFTRSVIGDLRGGAQWGQLRAFESRQRINSTVELSRSRFRVDWDAVDRDRYRIGCKDGSVIDLGHVEKCPADKSIITKCLGTSFDRAAQCPNWLAFLERIFEADQDLISYLQRAVGYSLTGDTSGQCFFVLVGNGSNGKSTFVNALQHLFGDYTTTIPMHSLTVQNGHNEQTNDLALLPGKRFVVASESEVGHKLAESRIKLMTGGDRIKCRRLYQEYFEFDPQFKLWVMTNNLPRVSGVEEAMWRRIHLIRFPVTIEAHERDGSLPEKLAAEAPGILNWALDGLRRWRTERLNPPEQVLSATAEYRQDNDTVGQFIVACCEKDPNAKTLVKTLYDRYSVWCERSGYDPLHKVMFGKTLGKKSFQKKSRSTGTEWKGIKLKSELKFDPLPSEMASNSTLVPKHSSDELDEILRELT